MTIFYPDVSSYNAGLRIQPGTVAVCARATLSDRVADGSYADFRAQAAGVGAVFFAYHWLNHGNLQAQARWCYQHVGGTPLMIDAEDVSGNTGYNGPLTVTDLTGFAAAYRTLGGVVSLVYLPHWYWQNNMGSPDLRPLAAAGLHLVSSNYTTYSDTGPGWGSYGGVTPDIWQYSSTFPYGGRAVDINAFRGTVAELATLIGDTTVETTLDSTYQRADGEITSYAQTLQDLMNILFNGAPFPAAQTGEMRTWLVKQLGALTTPNVTQDQVDAAVAKVMTDPAWIGQLAAAVAGHVHVS